MWGVGWSGGEGGGQARWAGENQGGAAVLVRACCRSSWAARTTRGRQPRPVPSSRSALPVPLHHENPGALKAWRQRQGAQRSSCRRRPPPSRPPVGSQAACLATALELSASSRVGVNDDGTRIDHSQRGARRGRSDGAEERPCMSAAGATDGLARVDEHLQSRLQGHVHCPLSKMSQAYTRVLQLRHGCRRQDDHGAER